MSRKITLQYVFSSNLIVLEKIAYRNEIFGLLSGWVKIHKIPHVIFETKLVRFLLNFASLLSIYLLYFFNWNFILFWRKESIKMPNFRLSISPNLDLDRLLLLKVYKISAKNYSCVVVHGIEDWCKIWKKTDLLFEKWQEFGEFWSESQICTLWLVPSTKSM